MSVYQTWLDEKLNWAQPAKLVSSFLAWCWWLRSCKSCHWKLPNSTHARFYHILVCTEDMDDLLKFCFKCAIKGRVGKKDLPLLTSTFLKGHMQPFWWVLYLGSLRVMQNFSRLYKNFCLRGVFVPAMCKLDHARSCVNACLAVFCLLFVIWSCHNSWGLPLWLLIPQCQELCVFFKMTTKYLILSAQKPVKKRRVK